MSRGKQIYEGKAKILYEGPEPNTLIQYFKDDATAFNAKKRAVLDGKGALNNRISEFIMLRLEEIAIPTHFIKRLNMREQLIKKVEMLPLEVICRNIAAGTLVKRLGLKEGERLPRSLIEFCLKRDDLGDPQITEEHIYAFDWASTSEYDEIVAMTLRINDYLRGLFAGIGIDLVDFKIEFGRYMYEDNPQILLADEISPDSCRLWDRHTRKKLDKDRFRQDLGNVTEAYQDVATRLGILKPEIKAQGKPTLTIVNPE